MLQRSNKRCPLPEVMAQPLVGRAPQARPEKAEIRVPQARRRVREGGKGRPR